MRNKLFLILIVLSFLGFADATYLAIADYKHIVPPCTVIQGCERVLTSNFATIYGIPLAAFGSIYFLISVVLNVLALQRFSNIWMRRIFILFNTSGLIAAIILLYLQFVVIKAFCQYCLLVELILFLLFFFSIFGVKKTNKIQ